MTRPLLRSPLTDRLDEEWARLRFDARALRRAERWLCVHVAEPLDDLDAVIELTHRRHGAAGNDRLGDLVRAAAHDELAGRIVLQRILPGVLHSSRRFRFTCRGDGVENVVIPAAWIAIRRYDVDRRQNHIAARLVSDSVQAAFRAPLRSQALAEEPSDGHSLDRLTLEVERDGFVEFAEVIADARRAGVSEADLELLCDLVRTGTPRRVAEDRCVTTRTIRNRRARAVEAVRRVIAA